MGVSSQYHFPTTLYLEEEPLVSTKKWLDQFQSQCSWCEKEKSLCCLCRESNQNFPFIQSVAKWQYCPSHPITHTSYVDYCFVHLALIIHYLLLSNQKPHADIQILNSQFFNLHSPQKKKIAILWPRIKQNSRNLWISGSRGWSLWSGSI